MKHLYSLGFTSYLLHIKFIKIAFDIVVFSNFLSCNYVILKGAKVYNYSFSFQCFRTLRDRMFDMYYNMYPFDFYYRNIRYFVAAFVIHNDERDKFPPYTLFHLNFMKANDLTDTYDLYINSRGILEYNSNELRNYFGIEYDPNGFGFMRLFCTALCNQCPDCQEIQNAEMLKIEKYSLCNKLDLDPEHCYRLSIMRLPIPKHRDPNKYQLALRIFPNASRQYADAYDVTYCFTSDAEREVTESEAIARFTHNERKRINHK